jgi:hypothetical protein
VWGWVDPLGLCAADASRKTAHDFYKAAGWDDARMQAHFRGIDFNKPVDIITIPQNTALVQYQIPVAPVGNYFAPVGTPGSQLGIYTGGRIPTLYTTTKDITVLRTTAAKAVDNWSVPGWNVLTDGGGTQYFLP